MKKIQGLAVRKVLFAALSITLIFGAIAQALPVFTGNFTLTNQVHWGKTVLQPGDYTITLESSNDRTFALVSDSRGRWVGRFMSGFDEGRRTRTQNALLIRENVGQMHVYSLELASLGRVLVFDPVLARELAVEARAPQTVLVMLAKR
jgi:hypothetical protein